MRIMRSLSIVAGVLLVASSAPAQVITGVVTDAVTKAPLVDASVVLLDEKGKIQRGTLTEPDGSYSIQLPKAGKFIVRAGGMGYETLDSRLLDVAKDQTVEMLLRLMPAGAVVGIGDFNRRRMSLEGTFLTEEDVKAKGGNKFTDVFRNIAGVSVVPFLRDTRGTRQQESARAGQDVGTNTVRLFAGTGGGEAGAKQQVGGQNLPRLSSNAAPTERVGLESANDCPPVLYVNGRWWGPVDGIGIDGPDYELPPRLMLAVEIYQRSEVPPEFDTGRDSQCGVIVVWKKDSK